PVCAQEGRGARFSFAPNVWATEKQRIPTDNYVEPAHNVQRGAVPRSLLGLDPNMLAKPAPQAPAPSLQVAARPVTTSVTPNFVPRGGFSPAFGTRVGAEPIAAQPAVLPQQAQAKPLAQNKPVAVIAQAPHHAASSVRARMLPPHKVEPSMATPAVASYGKD